MLLRATYLYGDATRPCTEATAKSGRRPTPAAPPTRIGRVGTGSQQDGEQGVRALLGELVHGRDVLEAARDDGVEPAEAVERRVHGCPVPVQSSRGRRGTARRDRSDRAVVRRRERHGRRPPAARRWRGRCRCLTRDEGSPSHAETVPRPRTGRYSTSLGGVRMGTGLPTGEASSAPRTSAAGRQAHDLALLERAERPRPAASRSAAARRAAAPAPPGRRCAGGKTVPLLWPLGVGGMKTIIESTSSTYLSGRARARVACLAAGA